MNATVIKVTPPDCPVHHQPLVLKRKNENILWVCQNKTCTHVEPYKGEIPSCPVHHVKMRMRTAYRGDRVRQKFFCCPEYQNGNCGIQIFIETELHDKCRETTDSIQTNHEIEAVPDDEIIDLTTQYQRVIQEIDNLEQQKLQLKTQIQQYIESLQQPSVSFPLDNKQVSLELKQQTSIEYDENLLKKRLGDKYRDILEIDAVKLRNWSIENKETVWQMDEYLLAPSPKKIEEMIENGTLDESDLAGTFTKRITPILYIKRNPAGNKN